MRRWLVSLLLVMTLAGCATATAKSANSASTPTATPTGQMTSAQVTRLSGFPTNHIPAFTAVISNAAKAQRLYAALLTLPVDKNPYRNCPMDAAVAYRITFYNGATEKLMAWVKPDGCANAKIGASSVIYATTGQFWQTFASALGVNEGTLQTWTPSSGPDAPPPGPNDWVTPFNTQGN